MENKIPKLCMCEYGHGVWEFDVMALTDQGRRAVLETLHSDAARRGRAPIVVTFEHEAFLSADRRGAIGRAIHGGIQAVLRDSVTAADSDGADEIRLTIGRLDGCRCTACDGESEE